MSENNPRVGSALEDLLREDSAYEDAKTYAIESVLAYRLARPTEAQNLSKARRATRLPER